MLPFPSPSFYCHPPSLPATILPSFYPVLCPCSCMLLIHPGIYASIHGILCGATVLGIGD
jgi:hypothetical protein